MYIPSLALLGAAQDDVGVFLVRPRPSYSTVVDDADISALRNAN